MDKIKIGEEMGSNIFYLETAKTSTKKETIDALLKESGLKRRRNYFYVAYFLASEGKNRNNLVFKEEGLKENHKTIAFTPVNWEHDRANQFGENIFSKIKEIDGINYIIVLAMFYEKNDYFRNSKIRERHSVGTLRFSMEADVKKYECETCHTLYDTDEYIQDICTCFKDGRIAKEFQFVGSGIVEDPADLKATSLDLASLNIEKKEKEMEEKLKGEIIVLKEDAEKKDLRISELEKEVASLRAELKEKDEEIAKTVSEKETLNSKVLEIEKASELKRREEEIKDLYIPEKLMEDKEIAMNSEKKEDFNNFIKIIKVINEEKASVEIKNVPDTEEKASVEKEEEVKNKIEIKSIKDLFSNK